MKIEILEKDFNAYEELQAYEQSLEQRNIVGACANFIGSMRDVNEGQQVTSMVLEHYAGMTEKQLQEICEEAQQEWDLIDILVLHRVGKIEITDHIVLVGVWSSHRKEAFEACRFIMEYLKSKAPFWKKEQTVEGDRWVESNTKGY